MTVTIRFAAPFALLVLGACQTVPAAPVRPVGGWAVTAIAGGGIVADSMPSMNFDADGRVSGSTGCNSFSGSYSLDRSGMKIGPLAMTRKSCGSELDAQESRMNAALGAVTRWDVRTDGRLILSGANGSEQIAARP